ncbi:TonB-dependent receptor [Steroidobacter agaridevorans]|uniref:TonB-dependent receptor n=1 Tax=Steroidobacter agaridevorans TaxID=2695856 RepID=A0A829YAD3_9GAMM|nr:TonB-dependent receptor [Steroidobacter agaridevorans]GFE80140.1 TonB-dependent receptor [Steroidobacter agaridevorans]
MIKKKPLSLAAAVILTLSAHAQVIAQQRTFDVPKQPAVSAIPELARQADIQIVAPAGSLEGIYTPAVVGELDLREALRQLLQGTGLEIASIDDRVILLRRQEKAAADIDADNASLETVLVTAQGPIERKRNSAVVLDSSEFDDVETLASDHSIAAMAMMLPGVSADEDGDQPKYITIRGLQADLNHTTIDGISIASVGNNGSGERRINLQLVPSQISWRTDISKAFSAEQDAGAIGGVLDVVTRSAFDRNSTYFLVDGYGIYSTYSDAGAKNVLDDANDHWGQGMKAIFSTQFGPDNQFGVLMSGSYQSRSRNASKLVQDRKGYFSDDGAVVGEPNAEAGWNGIVSPMNFGYGSFPNTIENQGTSVKLEWQPVDSNFQGSLLYFSYSRKDDWNEISNDIYIPENPTGIIEQDENGGRLLVRIVDSIWANNTWTRNNEGYLGNLQWQGENSVLSLKAGHTYDNYRNVENMFQSRASGLERQRIYVDYVNSELPQITGFVDPSAPASLTYRLQGGQHTQPFARETVDDVRLDYSWNAGPEARGLGIVTGLEWRRLVLSKDVERTVYATGTVVNPWMIDPGAPSLEGQHYWVPWLDGRAFIDEAVDSLPVNATSSRSQSIAQDFKYAENLSVGYVSAHYATDRTLYLLGLRYDRIDFDAWAPVTRNGVIASGLDIFDGGYDHLLPSFNVRHRLTDDINLRFSYSHTLGRPRPADIAAAQSINCTDSDEGENETCSITRGNPDLKPQRSRNVDLSVEKYFNANRGAVSLGYFHKTIKDNIFTLTGSDVIDGVDYTIRQPTNLDEMTVQGVEFSIMNRGMRLLGQRFDASLNASWFDGETTYVTDAGSRSIDRLLYQPEWVANASVTYRMPWIHGAARVAVNARGPYMNSTGGLKAWEDAGRNQLTTTNFSLWHSLGEHLTIKYEATNLFDEQPDYGKGEDLQILRQMDDYGRSFYLHVIWNL